MIWVKKKIDAGDNLNVWSHFHMPRLQQKEEEMGDKSNLNAGC